MEDMFPNIEALHGFDARKDKPGRVQVMIYPPPPVFPPAAGHSQALGINTGSLFRLRLTTSHKSVFWYVRVFSQIIRFVRTEI